MIDSVTLSSAFDRGRYDVWGKIAEEIFKRDRIRNIIEIASLGVGALGGRSVFGISIRKRGDGSFRNNCTFWRSSKYNCTRYCQEWF